MDSLSLNFFLHRFFSLFLQKLKGEAGMIENTFLSHASLASCNTPEGLQVEYEKLMEAILATEQAARRMTMQVGAPASNVEAESALERECTRIRELWMDRARRRVFDLEQEMARQAATLMTQENQALSEALRKLEETGRKNQEQWVDTLFHQIIGDRPDWEGG
jgi:hypothetical protein